MEEAIVGEGSGVVEVCCEDALGNRGTVGVDTVVGAEEVRGTELDASVVLYSDCVPLICGQSTLKDPMLSLVHLLIGTNVGLLLHP